METTNSIKITQGPAKEDMDKIYKAGGQPNVYFDLHYGINRTACVNILSIEGVEEKHVKMLASIPAGFFMYSDGSDFFMSSEESRFVNNSEKTKWIQVYIFYTTNTRKGYIEKVNKE